MEGELGIWFLRNWMHNIDLIMDCELCFRNNSGQNVSFCKICISFAAKAECCSQ